MNDLLSAAHQSLGYYPQAVRRGDGWEYRTPWQDGWNKALLALLDNYTCIMDWIAGLTPEAASAIRELLAADELFLTVEGGTVSCLLNMNDTFAYACADAEEVPLGDLPAVLAYWHTYGASGLKAWVAIRRGEVPLRQDERYLAAARAGVGESDKEEK